MTARPAIRTDPDPRVWEMDCTAHQQTQRRGSGEAVAVAEQETEAEAAAVEALVTPRRTLAECRGLQLSPGSSVGAPP